MEQKKIWNISEVDVQRQLDAAAVKHDTNSPIQSGYNTLQPCNEAASIVLADKELTKYFRDILLRG